MNYKWNYQPPTEQEEAQAEALSLETGISPVLCRLLLDRGVTTGAEAKRFFRPSLTELHDPFLMDGMDAAVARINKALGRKERILVYGDYDVDGTTAVALVYKFLQQFSSNIDYYIPDRNEDGYGISRRGIDYASSTGVKLVIVLDCGIKAIEEIEDLGGAKYNKYIASIADQDIVYYERFGSENGWYSRSYDGITGGGVNFMVCAFDNNGELLFKPTHNNELDEVEDCYINEIKTNISNIESLSSSSIPVTMVVPIVFR